MNLSKQKFTIRQVAEIHGEKIPTLQSWADKGWARITAAPGPGQVRELSLLDVYALSIAAALTRIGVTPQLANLIAYVAIHQPDNDEGSNTVHERAKARIAGERGYPDWEAFASEYRVDPADPDKTNRDLTISTTLADVHPAFREHSDPHRNPHLLYAGVGDFSAQGKVIQDRSYFPTVSILHVGDRDLKFEMFAGSGFYLHLTELLCYTDLALAGKLGSGPHWVRTTIHN